MNKWTNEQMYKCTLTHVEKILLFEMFSIALRNDQGCTDWYRREHHGIASKYLRHSSRSNMKIYHVFELGPLIIPFAYNIELLTGEEPVGQIC